MVCYIWTALSGSTADAPVGMGVSRELERAQRDAAEPLRQGRAFLALVEAVQPVIAVHNLAPDYVRTGTGWVGRRTVSGGITWRRFFVQHGGTDSMGP